MNYLRLAVFVTLALCGTAHAADTSCTAALTATSSTPPHPLPSTCASVGPLRLGMTHAEMIRALGSPDMDSVSKASESMAVYVFPRDLAARLAAQPAKQADLHHTDLYVVFHKARIVAIQVEADPQASFPYAISDLAINGSVDALLSRIKTPAIWNATKDNARFSPYPMDVEIDPDTRQVVGATIAVDARAMHMIPRPHFNLTKNPAGLVSSYWVSKGG